MDDLSRYGRTQRGLEWLGIGLFALLMGLNFWKIQTNPLQFAIFLLAAWIAADLLSGVAHWLFDTFGSVKTPVVGPAFIRPFREHHVDPAAMTRHDFVETNGSSALACVPLLLLGLYVNEVQIFTTFLSAGILVTNQCHKWAHMDEPGRVARVLQRTGLVLRPEAHRRHHTAPFASHYCTASGWLNPLLDSLLRRGAS